MSIDKRKEVSLSWLVVSTRHYIGEYDWIWDKAHHCCYGVPKEKMTGSIVKSLRNHYINRDCDEAYYEECVIMPELQKLSIEEAAAHLRIWCDSNKIPFTEDLDSYKRIEASYWGYDDLYEEETENTHNPYLIAT